jgi:tetratricopeptide (TPR) repeat protein
MNTKFEQGILEFENKNYEKALIHFEGVDGDDGYYEYALSYRISCLMKLEKYREALGFLNELIENNPYVDILWFEKAMCHIYLNEDEKAFSALDSLERVVDSDDKVKLLHVAKLYNILNDDLKVVEYCDKALDVDENFREAILEKSTVVLNLNDPEAVDEVSKRIVDLSDNSLISLMPAFLLKLFSKDYRGCLDVIGRCDEGSESTEMVKSLVYKNLSEDLNAQILLTCEIDLSIDEAIDIMLDFKESGKDNGKIHGVQYFVL